MNVSTPKLYLVYLHIRQLPALVRAARVVASIGCLSRVNSNVDLNTELLGK